jgi:hypothetical protein
METFLVRLKPTDPKRGHVLRRFTYRGIRFESARGWYRVEKEIADYLRTVRQVDADPHSPLAFDVASEEDARRLEAEENAQNRPARASDDIPVTAARPAVGTVTTADLPEAAVTNGAGMEPGPLGRRGRKERE